MGVAPKGVGKTTGNKEFIGPMLEIEQDEKKKFERQNQSQNRKTNKGSGSGDRTENIPSSVKFGVFFKREQILSYSSEVNPCSSAIFLFTSIII